MWGAGLDREHINADPLAHPFVAWTGRSAERSSRLKHWIRKGFTEASEKLIQAIWGILCVSWFFFDPDGFRFTLGSSSMVDIRYSLLLSVTLTNGPINLFVFISVNAGPVSTWRMMARLAWTSTSAPPLSPAASDASTPTAPTNAYVWMAMKPWDATPTCARLWPVSLMLTLTPRSKISKHL